MQKIGVWFVCILLVVGAIITPQTTARAQSEYNRYNDGIIAVDYPNTWQADGFGDFVNRGVVIAPETIPVDFAEGNPNLLESTPLVQAILGDTPVLVIWVSPLSEVEGTPRDVMEDMFVQYNVVRTEHAGPISRSNATGVEAIGTMDINGHTIGFHAVMLMGEGRYVFAIGLATETTFAENRTTYADLLDSLELVDEQHLPTPLPVNVALGVDVPFSSYGGAGFSMLQPSDWQPEAIETFDGSLTLFCTPPAEPTQPYNSDLEAIHSLLMTGTWQTPPSPELASCVIDRTVVGVVTMPLALLDGGQSPAQDVSQRILTSGIVTNISDTRLLKIQNDVAAETIAVINGVSPVQTDPYGLYSLVIEHEGWLVIFAASAPLEDFGANMPIFQAMAYSLNLLDLPNYNAYSADSGMVVSYGAEVDRELSAAGPDEWRFYGSAGDMVAISVTSSDFDAILELLSENGDYLAENDDYNDTNPYILYSLPADGFYIIRVSSYSVGIGGLYHLSLQVPEVTVN